MSGRARDNRLVHFAPCSPTVPGDIVEVEITGAAPFHLISDKPVLNHRHTPGSQSSTNNAVNIGMPSLLSQK